MSPTGNKNYNNLQDAGWSSKNLVKSVKESLLDSYRTANECRVCVEVRVPATNPADFLEDRFRTARRSAGWCVVT
jgi:hypothetical protein